ncbi:MAG TPA: MarR family transcriptional regulator [Acidimicrobiales bacterium]|nr:MarR family transcriptional regulator [Acidimicrobiales bacterium]
MDADARIAVGSTCDSAAEAALDLGDCPKELMGALAQFAHAYLRWIDASADRGLTFLRLRLIDRLNQQGPAMMRTLADELRLTPRHMTALVDALEDERLVARRPHPTDRRATVVELTATGCEAANAVLAPSMNAIAGLFDEFTAEEMAELEALVGKLLTALRERGQRA